MPLKLKPPREGKSPNWTIRGTYLGVRVDRTTGSFRKAAALKALRSIERQIESGGSPDPIPSRNEPTFLSAAFAYIKAGRRRRYLDKLIEHIGTMPLSEIDQAMLDETAIAICPNTTPATRNTCVYTPALAVLRFAGDKRRFQRPKDSKGRVVTDYLQPEDAQAIITAAAVDDPELAVLLQFLLFTGVRLGEALSLEWDQVRLEERAAYIRRSKNGDPRTLLLREDLCVALEGLRKPHGRVWRFHQGGWLKELLLRAKLRACGLEPPDRPRKGERRRTPPHRLSWVNFHTFRHTWATWMRRYGGADVEGLVATGNWRDVRSARRYAHTVAREEWERADRLPAVGKSVEKA